MSRWESGCGCCGYDDGGVVAVIVVVVMVVVIKVVAEIGVDVVGAVAAAQ